MEDRKLNNEIDEAISELEFRGLLKEMTEPKPYKILIWLLFVALFLAGTFTLIMWYICTSQ